MDNLFSLDPTFRRVQYKKLSDNVREWQEEIGALVAEKLPADMGLSPQVVFQTVDQDRGYAIGSAVVSDPSTGKSIGIPIIVKSWHLAPLDLFFVDGKLGPLNDDEIAQVFYQNSLGTGVATRKPPPNMADDVFSDTRNPPLGGKYSYSSPIGSMLERISGTLGSKDILALKKTASDPQLLASFHKRGTLSVLKKYAEETPVEQQEENKDRAASVFTIKKDGPNMYRLYSAPDEVFDPVMVSTDRQGLKNWIEMRRAELWDLQQDPLWHCDRFGHFTLEAPKSPYGEEVVDGPTGNGVDGTYGAKLGPRKNPWVFDPLQDERVVTTIAKFGRYAVKDPDGVTAKGWVIPNVISFDGTPVSTKLFLSRALGAVQSRISGIPLSDDNDANIEPDRADPGKIGTLLHRDGDRVIATVPFQITSVTVYKNLRGLGIVTYKGEKANIILSPNVEGIVKLSDEEQSELGPLCGAGKNYIVSAKMAFVRMPRLCEVSAAPSDFGRPGPEYLDHNPIKVAQANGRYIFRGGPIAKIASAGRRADLDFNSLARHEADFLLRSWGLDAEKTAAVLDGTKTRIQLEVHNPQVPSPTIEKKAAPALPKALKRPIAALVKVAATLDDQESVDSVLSLGFITPQNLTKYISAEDSLREVRQALAKLLLASRMGISDIPEESARSAIENLTEVIDGLKKLKMLKGQKKTAAPRNFQQHVGGRLLSRTSPVGVAR